MSALSYSAHVVYLISRYARYAYTTIIQRVDVFDFGSKLLIGSERMPYRSNLAIYLSRDRTCRMLEPLNKRGTIGRILRSDGREAGRRLVCSGLQVQLFRYIG